MGSETTQKPKIKLSKHLHFQVPSDATSKTTESFFSTYNNFKSFQFQWTLTGIVLMKLDVCFFLLFLTQTETKSAGTVVT